VNVLIKKQRCPATAIHALRGKYVQGVQKVMKPVEKCNIKFIFILFLFLIIISENVHQCALHRDAHDESC
jgi:hypothetical protein